MKSTVEVVVCTVVDEVEEVIVVLSTPSMEIVLLEDDEVTDVTMPSISSEVTVGMFAKSIE